MTPLDADIARLIAQHRARRTLGYAWYRDPATTPAPRRRPSARAERQYKATWRAGKGKEAT